MGLILLAPTLGNNRLYGNNGDDVMNGDAEDDWLSSGDGAYRVESGRGNDLLRGDDH